MVIGEGCYSGWYRLGFASFLSSLCVNVLLIYMILLTVLADRYIDMYMYINVNVHVDIYEYLVASTTVWQQEL